MACVEEHNSPCTDCKGDGGPQLKVLGKENRPAPQGTCRVEIVAVAGLVKLRKQQSQLQTLARILEAAREAARGNCSILEKEIALAAEQVGVLQRKVGTPVEGAQEAERGHRCRDKGAGKGQQKQTSKRSR